MEKKIPEDEETPQEIPTKENPNVPLPEKDPNKNNPINPKENK